MSKRILFAFIIAVSMLLVVGCAGRSSDNSDNSEGTNEKSSKKQGLDMSAKEVVEKVSDVLTLPDMIGCGDKDDIDTGKDAMDVFEFLCDIDYEKVDEYYISYASDEENPTVEEVFAVKLKDEADVDSAKEELNARIDRRKTQFSTYKPEEVPKLNNAKVEANKNMVILVISNDAQNGIEVFKGL